MKDNQEEKWIRVWMPDGTVWQVPAQLVAVNRAAYYAHHSQGDKSVFKEEFAFAMSNNYELLDWAANNMNWSDVQTEAKRVDGIDPAVDYQDGWMNGRREVVEV